jgi:hypothetical protein
MPTTLTYAEIKRYDPFVRPEWRHERVLELVDRFPNPGRCSHRDDEYVRKLRSFILRWRARETLSQRESELLFEDPGLFHAYLLHERKQTDPHAAFTVEARVLADQPVDVIADRCGLLPGAVEWYERLFFDARLRLANRDWIMRQCLMPAARRATALPERRPGQWEEVPEIVQPFYDWTCKFWGYWGKGPAVELMLNGNIASRQPKSDDDLDAYQLSQWQSIMLKRSMQSGMVFPINRYNVMELQLLSCKLLELAKREKESGDDITATERGIASLLTQLTWASGQDAARRYEGTALGVYDGGAVELRDDELLMIGAGGELAGGDEILTFELPPPRPREGAAQGGAGGNPDPL